MTLLSEQAYFLGCFSGPLSNFEHYRTYIALENYIDFYFNRQKLKAKERPTTKDRYRDLRLFLNAAESFNNILDYYFYYFEESFKPEIGVGEFRKRATQKHPILGLVADIANAYKHCVREDRRGEKQFDKLWAKNLQKGELSLLLNIANSNTPGVESPAENEFFGPPSKLCEVMAEAYDFWLTFDRSKTELIDGYLPATRFCPE